LQISSAQIFERQTVAELACAARPLSPCEGEQGPVLGPVPLTPIQRWFFGQDISTPEHWNVSGLFEVSPEVPPDHCERAAAALLAHHDALRLRFRREESGWQQFHAEPNGSTRMLRVDLTGLSETEQQSEIARTAAGMHAGLSLSDGEL